MYKMSVRWDAKGGIFDSTTFIGSGEADAEVSVPLSNQRNWLHSLRLLADLCLRELQVAAVVLILTSLVLLLGRRVLRRLLND